MGRNIHARISKYIGHRHRWWQRSGHFGHYGRDDRYCHVFPAHQIRRENETETKQHRGQRSHCSLRCIGSNRQSVKSGQQSHARRIGGHFSGENNQLGRSGRPRCQNHRIFTGNFIGHIRIFQRKRAGKQELHQQYPFHAGNRSHHTIDKTNQRSHRLCGHGLPQPFC